MLSPFPLEAPNVSRTESEYNDTALLGIICGITSVGVAEQRSVGVAEQRSQGKISDPKN